MVAVKGIRPAHSERLWTRSGKCCRGAAARFDLLGQARPTRQLARTGRGLHSSGARPPARRIQYLERGQRPLLAPTAPGGGIHAERSTGRHHGPGPPYNAGFNLVRHTHNTRDSPTQPDPIRLVVSCCQARAGAADVLRFGGCQRAGGTGRPHHDQVLGDVEVSKYSGHVRRRPLVAAQLLKGASAVTHDTRTGLPRPPGPVATVAEQPQR